MEKITRRWEGSTLAYFFTPEAQLPAGMGFSRFGMAHLAMLGCILAWTLLVLLVGCRLERGRRLRLLRGMALTMVGLEILKDGTLWALGAFTVGYLPLHLCSLAMLLCLYWAWHPENPGAGTLVWTICFAGGLGALLFPDWTDMPLLHFQSLHSFLYHGLLVQFASLTVVSGMAKPGLGQTWKVGTFLLGVAVPVYVVDRLLGTNYMFLLRPVPGTPLEWCSRLPGRWGYYLGYGALVAVCVVLLNLPFTLWRRKNARKSGDV